VVQDRITISVGIRPSACLYAIFVGWSLSGTGLPRHVKHEAAPNLLFVVPGLPVGTSKAGSAHPAHGLDELEFAGGQGQ
jgi:hypothetical protein